MEVQRKAQPAAPWKTRQTAELMYFIIRFCKLDHFYCAFDPDGLRKKGLRFQG